jgi:hypothetical protein
MKSQDEPRILEWKEIKNHLEKINPSLSALIDQINPGREYPLIKAQYPFGDLIVSNGYFSHLGSLTNHISYSPIPLFLVLNKTLEVFIRTNDRVIPLNVLEEGDLVGLFETIDALFSEKSSPPWYVSSGMRSIFLLPRITDQSRYKRLDLKYQISSYRQVRKLEDHWYFFKNLAESSNFNQQWYSEILIFTSPWFNRKKNDSKAWRNFYDYIFEQAWKVASFALSKFNVSLEWESFVSAVSKRRLKPNPYISDNIKHLMMLAEAKLPGFMPNDDSSERAGPISKLEDFFLNEYKLKSYAPIFMHTAPLTMTKKKPVYYSLAYPTLLEGAPGTSNNKTIILDLLDIMTNIKTIQERVERGIFKDLEFAYFHTEKNTHAEVNSSGCILDYDKRFLKILEKSPSRAFPDMSQFWRGCIGIKKKKSL